MPNDTMVCEGNTLPDVAIKLSGKPDFILQYTLNNNPFTITTSSSAYVIAKAAIGNYQITSLKDANGCENTNPSSTTQIQQIASPRFDYTITAGTICSGATVILNQSGSEDGIVYHVYQKEGLVSTKLINFTGDGNAMAIDLPSTSLHDGLNLLQVEALGCVHKIFTDTALVTVVGNKLSINGNAQVCDNNHENLSYHINPVQGVNEYLWQIDKSSATFVGPDNNTSVQVTLGQDNSYTLSVIALVNGQACLSTGASLHINQKSAYKGDTLVLSKDSICSEEYTSLSIPTQTATAYQHWVFPVGTEVSTTDSINFVLKCFNAGIITVQPADACTSTILPLTKAIVVYQRPVAFAGEDINLKGYPVNIALQGENKTVENGVKYAYQWQISKGTAEIVGATTLTPAIHPNVVESSYVFTISTPSNTCSSSDSVRVRFEIQMSPPLIFSPNGDGKNDFWVIEGIDFFPNATVEIFNQWGLKVYAKTGEYLANPWDGGDLPIATYYYTIIPNVPGLESTVGSVTLVR
jgi:gliding motility-associated-like protein